MYPPLLVMLFIIGLSKILLISKIVEAMSFGLLAGF
jgi:hypothetical protein